MLGIYFASDNIYLLKFSLVNM